MVGWCYSEVIVRYDGEPGFGVGILIHEKPIINLEGGGTYSFAILSRKHSRIIKIGWKRKRKLRDYVLYNKTSYSYATRSPKRFIGKPDYKIILVSLNNHLYEFDKTIIKDKFPHMSENVFTEKKNKRK